MGKTNLFKFTCDICNCEIVCPEKHFSQTILHLPKSWVKYSVTKWTPGQMSSAVSDFLVCENCRHNKDDEMSFLKWFLKRSK